MNTTTGREPVVTTELPWTPAERTETGALSRAFLDGVVDRLATDHEARVRDVAARVSHVEHAAQYLRDITHGTSEVTTSVVHESRHCCVIDVTVARDDRRAALIARRTYHYVYDVDRLSVRPDGNID